MLCELSHGLLLSAQLSPSVSRELNRDCIFWGFYSAHNLWHFLSAFALFFSMLVSYLKPIASYLAVYVVLFHSHFMTFHSHFMTFHSHLCRL